MQSAHMHRHGDMFIFRAAPTGMLSTQTTFERPDPLEPTAAINPNHPPIDELNVSTGQEWRWLLQQDHHSSTRSQTNATRRRKIDDSHAIALPKPPVRSVQRRPRLPPTLSGLYHPPPNAGLLPSISTEKSVGADTQSTIVQLEQTAADRDVNVEEPSRGGRQRKSTRNKWSEQETRDLLRGVERYGIGSWTAILKCSDYHFSSRTALDLKDRFRVCRPEDYGCVVKQPLLRRRCNERKTVADLKSIGMSRPFERTSRRKRHTYTDDEDARLLRGFQKHGKQWSRIQQDAELCLDHRTRTDIRDRLRNRFPELFEKAEQSSQEITVPEATSLNATIPNSGRCEPTPTNQQSKVTTVISDHTARNSSTDKPSLLPMLDPSWSFNFDDLEFNASSITLDRDILNWPLERQNTAGSSTFGVAPQATLQPGLPSIVHDQQADPWPSAGLLPDSIIPLPANSYHIPNLQSHIFG